MERFETPPAKNSTALSESQAVSPCLTPPTNDSSTLVQDSNETLRSENERLKLEIQKLQFDLNSDVQHDKIKVLTNTIDLNKSTIENYKEQVELYEQMILYEKSNTSRKGRLQKVNVTSKLDMKTTRDVMTLHVTPICKFVSKQQLRSISGLANIIMDKLNIASEHRIMWWATHYEVVETLLVEHKTKSAQRMKLSFKKGESQDSPSFGFKLSVVITLLFTNL